jgi:hypothetical protein
MTTTSAIISKRTRSAEFTLIGLSIALCTLWVSKIIIEDTWAKHGMVGEAIRVNIPVLLGAAGEHFNRGASLVMAELPKR